MSVTVSVDLIGDNPYQTRTLVNEVADAQLLESIRSVGLLVPLLIRPHPSRPGHFIVVDGMRRLGVARRLGWDSIQADIRELTEADAAKATVTTNLQRAGLNPIDEAMGFRLLIDRFNLTHEAIAGLVGRSRPQITNSLRLLDLDYYIKTAVMVGPLSRSQAFAILGLPEGYMRWRLASIAIEWELTVAEIKYAVKEVIDGLPFIDWVRQVPVSGLFGWGEDKDEGLVGCLATGRVYFGGSRVSMAVERGETSVEAIVFFPVNLLCESLEQVTPLISNGASEGLSIRETRIIPKPDPERWKVIVRHLDMLRGMERRYPVLVVSEPPMK